jgi:hypothetical protein
MEIKSLEKEKQIKIDPEKGVVILMYTIKMKLVLKNKELELTKTLSEQLLFNYDSDDAVKQITMIEHEMYEMERKAEKLINSIKELFEGLEQIIGIHAYKII